MIHPSTELRYINESIGYGVFARSHLPQGTILYVQDELEIKIPAADPRLTRGDYRRIIDIFATIEADGSRLLSWDIAKHVNHSCRANTLSTAYGIEIAVRPIKAGEEITDDYGLLNLAFDLRCDCGEENCRGIIRPVDFDQHVPSWDEAVKRGLAQLQQVPQPLWPFLSEPDRTALAAYLNHEADYRSTAGLKFLGLAAATAGSGG